MTHLDEGTVQALLHHELATDHQASAEEHLASCQACRAMVREAQAEDEWVLGRLAVLEEATRTAEPPVWRPTVVPGSRGAGWRRAAGLLIVLGGSGVLWAMPAVRSWVQRTIRQEPSAAVTPASPVVREPTLLPETPSGVAIIPGQRFVIEIVGVAGRVRVRLDDRRDVSIIAQGGHVAFESEEGRVRVRPDSAASITVEVPRRATSVDVVLAGRRAWLTRSGLVTTSAPRDGEGWYQLPPPP